MNIVEKLNELAKLYSGQEIINEDGSYTQVADILLCAAADVAEVRHGKWIEQEDGFGDTYYDCSCCGESFCLIDGTPTDNMYNFCPNCGARMDGE